MPSIIGKLILYAGICCFESLKITDYSNMKRNKQLEKESFEKLSLIEKSGTDPTRNYPHLGDKRPRQPSQEEEEEEEEEEEKEESETLQKRQETLDNELIKEISKLQINKREIINLLNAKANIEAENHYNWTPLEIAISNSEGNDIYDLLYSYGAKTEKSYALRFALYNGHFRDVKWLVEHGAKIDYYYDDDTAEDCFSLQWALQGYLDHDIVKYLIDKKADVNQTYLYNGSVLITVLREKNAYENVENVLAELLWFSADVYHEDDDHHNALFYAKEEGLEEYIKKLLEEELIFGYLLGRDFTLRNDGKTNIKENEIDYNEKEGLNAKKYKDIWNEKWGMKEFKLEYLPEDSYYTKALYEVIFETKYLEDILSSEMKTNGMNIDKLPKGLIEYISSFVTDAGKTSAEFWNLYNECVENEEYLKFIFDRIEPERKEEIKKKIKEHDDKKLADSFFADFQFISNGKLT